MGIAERVDAWRTRWKAEIQPAYRSLRRNRDYHFAIYACARTGSTSLRRALSCYAGIYCAEEPFNPDVPENVRGRIADLASLKREVGRLWERYNGFKHVWRPDRSRFDDPEMDDYLLTQATDRVVVMNRKNVLQRVVSTHMSEQHHVWQVWGEGSREKIRNHRFAPLDAALIAQDIAAEREASQRILRRLDETRLPYLNVWYEDVFGEEAIDKRISALGRIIEFVARRPFRRRALGNDALPILHPVESKLNSVQTYERVPNIHEIDRMFGNEQTGYLFA